MALTAVLFAGALAASRRGISMPPLLSGSRDARAAVGAAGRAAGAVNPYVTSCDECTCANASAFVVPSTAPAALAPR